MREKRWILKEQEGGQPQQAALQACFGCSPVVAQLLCQRGLTDLEAVRRFTEKNLTRLYDPFLMKDMEKACRRIESAMEQGEKITVYGDYDVDGVTSTSILVTYLQTEGCQVDYYIPDRQEEGYGVNPEAIRRIAEKGTKLLITVDCGVTATGEVELASSLGVDVIITDHHECSDHLPKSYAVVNPRQKDCPYPFKELAGVGVAFKLICGLEKLRKGAWSEAFLRNYMVLTTIGTIADVMPLIDENRIIVQYGLDDLEKSENLGLKALLNRAAISGNKKITSGTIGFTIAPRINAAGRMGCAARAVEMFLTHDPKLAFTIAQELCDENQQRQQMENNMMKEALELLHQRQFSLEKEKVIVLWKEGWHHGVIGIAASRISEIYHCPVIMISLEGDMGKGSGRSIQGFNLYQALEHCSGCLEKYGGHELAAGLSVRKENLETLRQEMNQYAKEHLDEECLVPKLEIDCRLEEEDLSLDTAKQLHLLEPYGVGNATPVFEIDQMELVDLMAISNDKHIRLTLRKGDVTITAFAFSTRMEDFYFSRGDKVDVACNLDINCYRGRESLQLVLKDIRLSQSQQQRQWEDVRFYQALCRRQPVDKNALEAVIPCREKFVAVYRYIRQNGNGTFRGNLRVLNRDITWYSKSQVDFTTMMICFDVLKEFELIDYRAEKEIITIELMEKEGKVNLNHSAILRRLREMCS